MNNHEINDIRAPKEFKGFTFSKFKKSEVREQLIQNMMKGKYEPACYWGAELVCAGHYMDLWEVILHYVGKHIHLGNPKIVIYLEMRYEVFRNIMKQGHYSNELQLRNNPTIRNIFAEVIATLTFSNRKNSFESIKINRVEEFDITQMSERLKAPSIKYCESIFKKEDPKELYISINEFIYNISEEGKNMLNACYWIEWIIEFDLICKKRKEPIYCERRKESKKVEYKFQKDIIWMIWEAIVLRCDEMKNALLSKILNSTISLFSIKYTTGCCKKRRYLFYFAISLLTEMVPTNIEITTQKDKIQIILEKINEIYKQIKKNEETPGTDYLFTNLDKAETFERTIRKLEMVQSMDFATHMG
tara:strand:- start:10925 stop:12004 length:1080 start_codon:yes stop_codon:yes gene_type:complete